MSAEHSRVTGWMRDAMIGDSTLVTAVGGIGNPRIYAEEAPQNALPPMVLYAFLGGSDQLIGSNRLSNGLWLVRALGDGESYSTIEDIADRVDTRLTSMPAAGIFFRDVHILSCGREQPHQRKDITFGKATVYLGGFYRVRWTPVS